jgi:hypothetical protein
MVIVQDDVSIPGISRPHGAAGTAQGSSIRRAVEGGHFAIISVAMAAMSRAKATFPLAKGAVSVWHGKAFSAFDPLQQAAHAFQWQSQLPGSEDRSTAPADGI